MKIEIHAFSDLKKEEQENTAELVSSYTQGLLGETPQMLPISKQGVLDKHLACVALRGGEFSGFIGATEPELYGDSAMTEVGNLWVPLRHRKQGVAHKLISFVSSLLRDQGKLPYAFTNPVSMSIFQDEGYREVGKSCIPPSAFKACMSCPMKPDGDECCDKVLIYGGSQ